MLPLAGEKLKGGVEYGSEASEQVSQVLYQQYIKTMGNNLRGCKPFFHFHRIVRYKILSV